jgi:hypothetical protein
MMVGALPLAAQPFEQAGVRAQGMGGAFVAVADDASAVWWNPAGLASGPFFSLLVEHQRQEEPDSRVTGFAIGTPPLGLSYTHLRELVPPAAGASSGRETGSGELHTATLSAHVAGVTLLQSVTSGFVVGTTLKFVHGDIDGRSSNRVDLDLGAHYGVGALRAGIVVRNLAEPSFRSPADEEFAPRRHARAGMAWTGEATTVAADLDLTDVEGPWPGRRFAVGAEQRFGTRAAVRAGLRVRTSEGPDPWTSLGGSYALKPGVWLDGFWGRSPDQDARWAVGARVAY